MFKSTRLAVILNFAVGVPLLYLHGPTGVVVATILAELLRWGLLHRALARKKCRVPMVPLALCKQAMSAIFMDAIVWSAAAVVPRAGSLTVTGLVLLGAAVYAAGIVSTDATVKRTLRAALGDVQSHFGDAVSP